MRVRGDILDLIDVIAPSDADIAGCFTVDGIERFAEERQDLHPAAISLVVAVFEHLVTGRFLSLFRVP